MLTNPRYTWNLHDWRFPTSSNNNYYFLFVRISQFIACAGILNTMMTCVWIELMNQVNICNFHVMHVPSLKSSVKASVSERNKEKTSLSFLFVLRQCCKFHSNLSDFSSDIFRWNVHCINQIVIIERNWSEKISSLILSSCGTSATWTTNAPISSVFIVSV